MSQFLSPEAARLAPYIPGEQPRDQQYVKLNTNENPFPPAPGVLKAVAEEAAAMNLYSDPTCAVLCQAVAEHYGITPEEVVPGNGSDEVLNFAFRAFCGTGKGVAFADITYGFYKVWAKFYGLCATQIPLREDFSLCVDDYMDFPGTVVIANPNAPTGKALPVSEIRRLLDADRKRVVVIDEAYVDFGAESCVPLTREYDNLLVVQTLSKSRNLAGGRVGFGIACPALIDDLNRVRNSSNPYNVNRMSLAAGAAAMADVEYFDACCAAIMENRAFTTQQLTERGFTVLPSVTNFVFAESERICGETLYRKLKENGVLVRWFDAERIRNFCRISIGSREQMETLLAAVDKILKEA